MYKREKSRMKKKILVSHPNPLTFYLKSKINKLRKKKHNIIHTNMKNYYHLRTNELNCSQYASEIGD